MSDEISLPYGESFLTVRLPRANVRDIIHARDMPGLADAPAAIVGALRQPVDSPALRDCVKSGDKVVIITTDNTRACPDDLLVPLLLAELEPKIPARDITIMIALGLHAPLTEAELIRKLGRRVVENYRVLNHDPQDIVALGTTSFGTPVEVNRWVAEADFRIGTGFVEPHFFAGFSGGRKCILPGVSSARSIRRNHGYEMVGHARAAAGVLDGNPVHEDMLESARLAHLDFILNVLLNREKQVTHVLAGNPWTAHRRACEIEKEIVSVQVDRPADITLVTNGGAPLDLDFYQTVKGIDTAVKITRPGGIIIVASSCHSGPGPESFCSLQAAAETPQAVLERIRAGQLEGVAWQNQILARVQLEHSVYLVSGLAESTARRLMVTPFPSVEAALEEAFLKLGREAAVSVIPEGPLVLPVLAGEA